MYSAFRSHSPDVAQLTQARFESSHFCRNKTERGRLEMREREREREREGERERERERERNRMCRGVWCVSRVPGLDRPA